MFKVGQKVVCIDGYESCGLELKTGQIYTIISLSECCSLCLNVGIKHPAKGTYCNNCNKIHTVVCHSSTRFIPLDETFAEEVLENIKQQIEEEELILTN